MLLSFSLLPVVLILSTVVGVSLYLKHLAKPKAIRAPSGFLSCYAKLNRKSADTQFYMSATTDWPTQIYFEPVSVLCSKQSQQIPIKYLRMLATYFEYAMREAVDLHMEVINQPNQNCIHVRTAIVDIQSANPVKNFFSRRFMLVPIDFGMAAIEGELLSTQTGQQLAAIVDHQVGGVFSSPFHHAEWSDVMQAFDRWAKQLHQLLTKTPAYAKSPSTSTQTVIGKILPMKFKH